MFVLPWSAKLFDYNLKFHGNYFSTLHTPFNKFSPKKKKKKGKYFLDRGQFYFILFIYCHTKSVVTTITTNFGQRHVLVKNDEQLY